MTKINVKHISKLANLPITEEIAKKLDTELDATLEHIERLNEIDTANTKGTNEVVSMTNVMREDEVKPPLTQAEALMNAKKVHNGFFVVPVIIEEAIEN